METVLFILSLAIVMIIIETKAPGRRWRHVSGWWIRASVFNLFQVFGMVLATYTWDRWFPNLALWNIQESLKINTTVTALLGYLLITFIFYWWHRWRHESAFLWRYLHQIHHSPERIEIVTAFYKHPLEILINSLISSILLHVFLGVTPEAAGLTILMTGVAELIYHWNVKTPYWLGFIFQRPESHCIHHKQGWHRQNYSDLPFWDMLFGTFYNPKESDLKCGFANQRELNVKELLIGYNLRKKS